MRGFRRPRTRAADERGAALVIAILALTILTAIGIALMLVTGAEARIAANEWSINRAFYGSDSGIRWVSVEMTNLQDFLMRPEFRDPSGAILPFGTVFFRLPSHRPKLGAPVSLFNGDIGGGDIVVKIQTPSLLGRRPAPGGRINVGTEDAQFFYVYEVRSTSSDQAFSQFSNALVAEVEVGPLAASPFAAPALPPPSSGIGDRAHIDAAVPSQRNEDGSPHGYSQKLGDIFHSEPAVLGPPGYFPYLSANLTPRRGTCGALPDCSYRAFAALHSRRRRVVFIGANDGFLHAFESGGWGRDARGAGALTGTRDLGAAREIFAYAPGAVMNGKFPALLDFPPTPEYFVDGSVALADVFIDTSHPGTPSDSHRSWKTVLVGGLRQRGKYYYALDVTRPDKIDSTSREKTADKDSSPDCLNGSGNRRAAYPAVLWELTDDCPVGPADCVSNPPPMGETRSRPVIGRIKASSGNGSVDRYVAIFGGGFDSNFTPGTDPPASTIRGRALYVVSVETGRILYKAAQGVDDVGRTVQFAPMPAAPAVADFNDDGYLDVAYVGDLNGRVWRLDLSTAACKNCGSAREILTFGSPHNPQPSLLYDALTGGSRAEPIQPIFYDPGIIFMSGGTPPRLGIAFGSGYSADLRRSNGTAVNRFVLVIDSGTGKTFHDSDLINLTPSGGATPAGTGPAATDAGYFLDFATHDEKAVSTVFSTLGNLSVLTFALSGADASAPGGDFFRYRFNFATGLGGYRTAFPPAGRPGSLADYRATLGGGMAAAARGQSARCAIIDFTLGSSGRLIQQRTPMTLKTLSESWKEQ